MTVSAERGSTLIELLVAVGILALVAGATAESMAARPAAARSAIVATAGLVAQTRGLAAVTAGDPLAADGGATLAFTADGDGFRAMLYRGAPGNGAAVRADDTPPRREGVAVAARSGGAFVAPPFAIVVSPAGDAQLVAGDVATADAQRAAAPCDPATGIVLRFGTPPQATARRISCAAAQLDSDTVAAPT